MTMRAAAGDLRCRILKTLALLLCLVESFSVFVATSSSDRTTRRQRHAQKNEAPNARRERIAHPPASSVSDTLDGHSLRYRHVTDVRRIFCLSDLHTDHVENMRWLRDQVAASTLSRSDLVIVAGDISHDFSTFTESLKILCERCQVLFVPGNHEAWLTKQERNGLQSSLDKLDRLYTICREHGVFVDPVYIDGMHPIWILPLESWYDGTLTFDEELCEGFEHWPWVDFARCDWGDRFPEMKAPNARIPLGLTEFFLERNRVNILDPWRELLARMDALKSAQLLTVSHFAPNKQCLPDWKDLESSTFLTDAWLDHGAGHMSAKFSKVAGTALLDDQIRDREFVQPRIHIFGHSHRPKDFEFKGIRYIHNPLGKPRERQLQMVAPDVDFQCIWDVGVGEVKGETVIRYWEERGGGKEMLWKRMAEVRPGRYQQRGGSRERRR